MGERRKVGEREGSLPRSFFSSSFTRVGSSRLFVSAMVDRTFLEGPGPESAILGGGGGG